MNRQGFEPLVTRKMIRGFAKAPSQRRAPVSGHAWFRYSTRHEWSASGNELRNAVRQGTATRRRDGKGQKEAAPARDDHAPRRTATDGAENHLRRVELGRRCDGLKVARSTCRIGDKLRSRPDRRRWTWRVAPEDGAASPPFLEFRRFSRGQGLHQRRRSRRRRSCLPNGMRPDPTRIGGRRACRSNKRRESRMLPKPPANGVSSGNDPA